MDWTDTNAILDYYRDYVAGGSDYVGYSEPTLKTSIIRAAGSLPGSRVIEVGAGPNPVVPFALAKAGRDVTTVEISKDFCETARLNAQRNDVEISIICAPAHAIPLPDGVGDIVIMTEVLEHVPDELELPTLQELRRLVAPNGRLLISVPNADSLALRWNTWRNHGAVNENDTSTHEHLREYTLGRLEDRLGEAGFTIERALRVPATDRPFRETRSAWVIDRLAFRPAWGLKAAAVARPV
jgi:2-polyprenyl-3-methyl-5-hydroxy-6-metoxy-1,4-benzoquinol methylase